MTYTIKGVDVFPLSLFWMEYPNYPYCHGSWMGSQQQLFMLIINNKNINNRDLDTTGYTIEISLHH